MEDHINDLKGKLDEANNTVASRDQEIKKLKDEIASKDAKIAELGKKPAADTKQVNNEGGDETTDDTNPELKSYCDEMAEAQKMLDNLKK